MTTDPNPLRARLRALRRQIRDDKVHQGLISPRSQREMEIWRAGLADRFGLAEPYPASGPAEPTQPPIGPSPRPRRPPRASEASSPPDSTP